MALNILVTNDDGIDSPGLHALVECAARFGTVRVAAPVAESSGTSAGLTAARDNRRIAVERRTVPGCAEAYAVAATPGLIALAASRGGFGPPPDVVLSGVNRGANTGRAVLHSGTVGAALTAGINGARALAVSLDVELGDTGEPHWRTATTVVATVLPELLSAPDGAVFNVNAPNTADPGALRWAPLATYGHVQTSVAELEEGVIEVSSVVVEGELEPGTDADLLARRYSTITPLRSVAEAADLFPDR